MALHRLWPRDQIHRRLGCEFRERPKIFSPRHAAEVRLAGLYYRLQAPGKTAMLVLIAAWGREGQKSHCHPMAQCLGFLQLVAAV